MRKNKIKGIKRFHAGAYILDNLQETKKSLLRFSLDSGIDFDVAKKLVNCEISINNELAKKLAKYFNNTKEFWLNLQQKYDKTWGWVKNAQI